MPYVCSEFCVSLWLFSFEADNGRTARTLFRYATLATVYSAQLYRSTKGTGLVCDVYAMDVSYAVNGWFGVEVGTGHVQFKYGLSRGSANRPAKLNSRTGY